MTRPFPVPHRKWSATVCASMRHAIVFISWCPAFFNSPVCGDELHNYSASWVGNSFSGGDAGWVPQDVQDIFVAPDGSVFTTVGWEEHRGNIAVFKDGQLLQQTAHWKGGGIDRLVGDTICATEHHIFFATGTSEGRNGEITGTWLARRDRADVASRKPELRIEIGLEIHGVAASSDHVFASTSDGRVRVFDHELKPIGDWPAPAPGEMAIDASGHLWIVDTESRSILHFDAQGNRLPQTIALLEDVIPADIAITPNGELLVADGGQNRQVLVYHHLDSEPELASKFGERGGVFAGPTPGRMGERRFVALIGVGADAQGNLYVASGPIAKAHGGTTIIESYSPSGDLRWRVSSTEWLDTVDAVRASDATSLFGSRYRYSLDLSHPVGKQWTAEAFTLHPDRYPDDPRLQSPARGGVWHRVIHGKPYLFFPDMNGGDLFVFRFDPDLEGEIAIPCAAISTNSIWVDANENGRREDDEVTHQTTGETRGWSVGIDGTVWQASRHDGIFEYPLGNVGGRGVLVYETATRRHTPMPAPLTELRRIVYDRGTDTMFLGGSTATDKAEHWKPMGPNLIRFDNWTRDRRTDWQLVLPHEKGRSDHESYEPFDFAIEGDYIFVVYAGVLPSQNLPTGTVMVFDKRDRRYLGHMQPSGTRSGTVPMDALQDMVHSINAFRRADGEYVVFIEDDGYTKNVLYRWKP